MHSSLVKEVPLQYYQASFDCYYPSRRNGWDQHQIVFTRDIVQQSYLTSPVFNYNSHNGRIDILEEGHMMCVEVYWKGRAPWGYHMVWLYRNIDPELGYPDEGSLCHCSTQEECEFIHSYKNDNSEIGRRICNEKGYWSSHNGHLRCYFVSNKNDCYVINNTPAHIQGTPACFEVKISVFKDPNSIKTTVTPCITPITDQLTQLIDSNNDASQLYNAINELLKQSNYSHIFQADKYGVTIKEMIEKIEKKIVGDTNTIQSIKDLLCVNGKLHDTSRGNSSLAPSYRCWSCRSPLNGEAALVEARLQCQILAVDEDLYGENIDTNAVTYNAAANAAFHRGVSVIWLKKFCTYYDCWNWPTWRVVYNIIKPQTAGLRCRYIELPGVNADVGAVDIFISHSWGGCFGDVVAAAFNCISDDGEEDNITDVRVYLDIFAVRQWPGNNNDVVFEGVVANVRAVLVVCSSAELENIGELSFKDINERFLDVLNDQERRAIPFLRIWCLAEINSAVLQHIPLVIACGTYCFDIRTKKKIIFQTNPPLLYNMQFLVSTKSAKAEFLADQVSILGKVEAGVGFDQVDRQVRGAIIGALVYSKVPIIRKASVGSDRELIKVLEDYYIQNNNKSTPHSDSILQALCAAAAAGFADIFNIILEYNKKSSNEIPLLLMQDRDGLTALMHACRSGQRLIVSSIISQLTDIECNQLIGMTNNDNWTALAFAAQFGCAEVIRILLDGVDDVRQLVNTSLSGGQTALGIGLQNNCSLECCKILIDAGTDLEHRDGVGYTVIRHAVTPGKNPSLVTALLEAGANANEVDNWGMSILGWSLEGTVDSLKALLDFVPTNGNSKCDVNMINVTSGKSPLDRAIELNNIPMVEVLRGLGAMTLKEMMDKSGKGGCGKLLPSNVQNVMDKFNMSEAEAGLALASRGGRLDWTLSEVSKVAFPKPHDVVTMSALKSYGGRSTIVYRNSDNWIHSDEVDGGEYAVGYMHSLNRQCVTDNKVHVTWQYGQKHASYHCVENDRNSELRFAPYNYIQ